MSALDFIQSPVAAMFLRFAAHIPFFYATGSTQYYYGAISLDDAVIDAMPHGRTFLQGLLVAGITGNVIAFWNFVMFGVTSFTLVHESFAILGLAGIVDFILCVTLTIGLIQQAQYLPTSMTACQHAASWAETRFFTAAAQSEKFDDSANAVCATMVGSWSLFVGIACVLFVDAMLNILIGLASSDLQLPSLAEVSANAGTLWQMLRRRLRSEASYRSVGSEVSLSKWDDGDSGYDESLEYGAAM